MYARDDTYHIVLADDHALFRESIISLIRTRADLEVVGEAADGLELLRLLGSGSISPHMIILDISMPHMDGLEAAVTVKRQWPDMKILMLTIHNENEFVDMAIAAGADGYLLKEGTADQIKSAIDAIRAGGVYFEHFCPNTNIRGGLPVQEKSNRREPLSYTGWFADPVD